MGARARLAAFAPEGKETGSGAGRALFFVRCGCGLRRPTLIVGETVTPDIAPLELGMFLHRAVPIIDRLYFRRASIESKILNRRLRPSSLPTGYLADPAVVLR